MCEREGIPEAEALQLLQGLHRVGVVLHFHDHPTLRNHVFLHPNYVVDAVFGSFGLKGPTEAYTDKLVRVSCGSARHGQAHDRVLRGTAWTFCLSRPPWHAPACDCGTC